MQEPPMSVAKVIEIIAGSRKGFDDAIRAGVERATESLGDITGAWVKSQRVIVAGGKVTEYRVVLKVTFVLRPAASAKSDKPKKKK
jgi:flavin-binding protein dodecin